MILSSALLNRLVLLSVLFGGDGTSVRALAHHPYMIEATKCSVLCTRCLMVPLALWTDPNKIREIMCLSIMMLTFSACMFRIFHEIYFVAFRFTAYCGWFLFCDYFYEGKKGKMKSSISWMTSNLILHLSVSPSSSRRVFECHTTDVANVSNWRCLHSRHGTFLQSIDALTKFATPMPVTK